MVTTSPAPLAALATLAARAALTALTARFDVALLVAISHPATALVRHRMPAREVSMLHLPPGAVSTDPAAAIVIIAPAHALSAVSRTPVTRAIIVLPEAPELIAMSRLQAGLATAGTRIGPEPLLVIATSEVAAALAVTTDLATTAECVQERGMLKITAEVVVEPTPTGALVASLPRASPLAVQLLSALRLPLAVTLHRVRS